MSALDDNQSPYFCYCRHLKDGLVAYGPEGDQETIFINEITLKDMAPSLMGMPVYTDHMKYEENGKVEEKADGYIVNSFYNEMDGWLWAKMLIISDKAKDQIKRGFNVSNGYKILDSKEGGKHNNIQYDKELVKADFNHIALVDRPRYEGSLLLNVDEFKDYQQKKKEEIKNINNSKGELNKMKTKSIFNWFKMEEKQIENVDDIDLETFIPVGDKNYKLGDMINQIENKKNTHEKDEYKEKMNDKYLDDMYTVGDKKMKIRDIISEYTNMMEEKNKKNKENEEDDKKKMMEKDEYEKKIKDNEKKNSLSFNELKNPDYPVETDQVDNELPKDIWTTQRGLELGKVY